MPELVIWKHGQAPGGAKYPRGVCGVGGVQLNAGFSGVTPRAVTQP